MKKNATKSHIITSIKKALGSFPDDGASIEDLENKLIFDINRRTLQRRLKDLQESCEITITGSGRGTRYHLIRAQEKGSSLTSSKSYGIILSEQAKLVLDSVLLPQHLRKPVSYHRELLDNYKPNYDSYLSIQEKDFLQHIGKTIMPEHATSTYAKSILNRLLIDLSWNSSRLEGNTYSLLDTQRLVTLGEAADNKSTMETG